MSPLYNLLDYGFKVNAYIHLLLHCSTMNARTYSLDTVQDFLSKLGINPPMHLLEIGIFSLNHVIVRPTKIMNRFDKNWAQYLENKVFQKSKFSKNIICKSWSLSLIFFTEKNQKDSVEKIRKILVIFDAEK